MMGNLFGGGEQQADLEDEKTRAMFEHAVPFLGNSMTIQDIVKKVHSGHSGSWNNAVSTMGEVTGGHDEVSKHGQKLLQALESSWSGAGAEGAAAKLKQGMKAAEASSKVYSQNQQFYTDNAAAFDNVKRSLPSLPEQEPDPGFLDSLAPWETDTQAQAKKYQADIEQARQTYSKYEGNVVKAGQDVDGNFGNLQEFDGKLGDIERDASTTVKDSGSGVVDINEPGSGGGSNGGSVDGGGAGPVGGGSRVGDGSVPGGVPGGGVTGGGAVPGSQSPQYAGSGTSPNDTTGTSSYVSPDAARAGGGTYPTPGTPGIPGQGGGSGFGPGGSNSGTGFGPMGSPAAGFGPGGSAGAGSAGGGSPVGGGRLSVPGGGAAGGGAAGGGYSSGSGGAAGSGGAGSAGGGAAGGGGAGAGKMTGAGGGFGPTGSGGAGGAAGGAGGGAAAAGRGGMPMGAMGGAGRGGQGGDDEEHQRQYVLPDDEAFALTEDGEVLRDPSTGNVVTPPTIGE